MRPLLALSALAITMSATPAAAQRGGETPFVDPPRDEWDSVSDALRGHEWADAINNLLDVMRVMPDSLYEYRPTEEMRSFGGVVGHIADVHFYFCDRISERTGPDRNSLEEASSKEAVLKGLVDSIATCDIVFDSITDELLVADRALVADNLATMMGHTRRETGKLVTYLRLVRIEPPEIRYYAGRTWRRN